MMVLWEATRRHFPRGGVASSGTLFEVEPRGWPRTRGTRILPAMRRQRLSSGGGSLCLLFLLSLSPFSLALSLSSLCLLLAACSSGSGNSGGPDATPDATKHGDAHTDGSSRSDTSHPDVTDAMNESEPGRDGDTHLDATRDGGHDAGRDARPRDAAGPDVSDSAAADTGVDAGTPALRYIGRTLTDGTDPDGNGACTVSEPCYEWSGTQVVARFTGATSFALTMSDYGSYFDVYVDGALAGTPVVGSSGQTSYTLATGLSASSVHEVSLYKRTEASMSGRTMIQGYTFPGGGGMLLPPTPPAARRIEVVGDSISCGYGVLGPNASCDGTDLAYEDHADSYGAVAARSLGADLYTIASSGRGMYVNIDGTMTGTIPAIYGLTLPYGMGSGGLWPSAWSFASWEPDAVVIDLGTNDFLYNGDPGAPFEAAYVAFLQRVRQSYPHAWVFCANSPILSGANHTGLEGYIQQALTTLADAKMSYVPFPTQSQDASAEGCDGHPNVATQAALGAQLTTVIKAALGW